MKKKNKGTKRNKPDKLKENLNNSNLSEENKENEISIFSSNKNTIIEKCEISQNESKEEEFDLYEKELNLMDEYYKKNLIFEKNYESSFSINYPNLKIDQIPLFTPSTRLNNALQVDDKNECFIFYYTHKKSLFPTIYNQLIGICGSNANFRNKEEKDFIYANAKSIIFTNQRNFVNLDILLEEYIYPLMKENKVNEECQQKFIDCLLDNIHIIYYLTYEELFLKLNVLNINLMEQKIHNVGLVIIDGLNSVNQQKIEFLKSENGKSYKLKFYKSNNYYKGDNNSNKKNKRNSTDNKNNGFNEDVDKEIKTNLFGNNYDNNVNFFSDEILHQSIVNLVINYQEKYNFNLIITIFDFAQDNFYNLNISGKASYKEMNKNTYTVNSPELKKENCYFTFKLPKIFFPKKIIFIEPINCCLNYNTNIFGLLTNPINTQNLIFQVFKKEKNDYRPKRIVEQIEYQYK